MLARRAAVDPAPAGVSWTYSAALLSVPIASVVATVVDVALRGVEPAEESAPKLLFSADSEG
jgi:hypothetical protein